MQAAGIKQMAKSSTGLRRRLPSMSICISHAFFSARALRGCASSRGGDHQKEGWYEPPEMIDIIRVIPVLIIYRFTNDWTGHAVASATPAA